MDDLGLPPFLETSMWLRNVELDLRPWGNTVDRRRDTALDWWAAGTRIAACPEQVELLPGGATTRWMVFMVVDCSSYIYTYIISYYVILS